MNTIERRVSIGGQPYALWSDDDYLKNLGDEFEPETVRLFRSLVTPTDVAFDVGANIGCTTLLLSSLVTEVHAFEPSPSTFALLEKNVQQLETDRVKLHNVGLGSKAQTTTLTFSPNNRSGGFVSNLTQAGADHSSETIHIDTLDTLVERHAVSRLDFVKIDVEGFEAHVLRGAASALERFRPAVVLELNHWCLNAFQRTSVPDFLDELRARFPVLLAIQGDGYMNLHDAAESYSVMYRHIVQGQFHNLVACSDENRLRRFRAAFRHLQPRA